MLTPSPRALPRDDDVPLEAVHDLDAGVRWAVARTAGHIVTDAE